MCSTAAASAPGGPRYALPPVTVAQQRVAVYETASKYYVVGSDNAGTRFRVMKIDRMESRELIVDEDPLEYSRREIIALLKTIDNGNRTTGGLQKSAVGYGFIGFVRFLEGPYLYLIRRRRLMGWIGGHAVYGIDEPLLIPVPNRNVITKPSSEEQRYVSLFQSLDLTRDFYFSYTYDLSHTLQQNMIRAPAEPDSKFVWNGFLCAPLAACIGEASVSRWCVRLLHGFFEQARLSVFGRVVLVTLLARRSRHYAGTRYRKRGLSEDGYSANEVETEQIVQELSSGTHRSGHFAGFVQTRGSIPLFWSQDTGAMVPKPTINVNKVDPFYIATRVHFSQLIARHGIPLTILNLIKQEEKKARETLLGLEFARAVDSLNASLPPGEQIQYIAVDMKSTGKRGAIILAELLQRAYELLRETGFFHSGRLLAYNEMPSHRPPPGGVFYPADGEGREQTGIVRSNCIDSLDRTNVAQFIVARAALSCMLHAMGLLERPALDDDSEVLETFKGLFDRMGDSLALQYGGSNAVKSSGSVPQEGLTRAAQHSRDLITSLKRYYSNAFVDAARQDAMNIFLGVFVPQPGRAHVWDVDDYIFHNPPRLRRRRPVDFNWAVRALNDYLHGLGRAGTRVLYGDGLQAVLPVDVVAADSPLSADGDGRSPSPPPKATRPLLLESAGESSDDESASPASGTAASAAPSASRAAAAAAASASVNEEASGRPARPRVAAGAIRVAAELVDDPLNGPSSTDAALLPADLPPEPLVGALPAAAAAAAALPPSPRELSMPGSRAAAASAARDTPVPPVVSAGSALAATEAVVSSAAGVASVAHVHPDLVPGPAAAPSDATGGAGSPTRKVSPTSLSRVTQHPLQSALQHADRPGTPVAVVPPPPPPPLQRAGSMVSPLRSWRSGEAFATYYNERYEPNRLTVLDEECLPPCNRLQQVRLCPPPPPAAPLFPEGDGADVHVPEGGYGSRWPAPPPRVAERQMFARYLDPHKFEQHRPCISDMQRFTQHVHADDAVLRPVQMVDPTASVPLPSSVLFPQPTLQIASVYADFERKRDTPSMPPRALPVLPPGQQTVEPELSVFEPCPLTDMIAYARTLDVSAVLSTTVTETAQRVYERACNQDVYIHYDSVVLSPETL